jgi:hypothetical protein
VRVAVVQAIVLGHVPQDGDLQTVQAREVFLAE